MRFIFPPKIKSTYKSANVDLLAPITFSETDIDRMLTQIAERMIKKGRSVDAWSPARKPEIYDLDSHVELLRKSSSLKGFGGKRGSQILRGWLLATVVTKQSKKQNRSEQGLGYIAPLTAAAYRTGLPKERQRHRRADQFVYSAMATELLARGEGDPSSVLRGLCELTIGRGVNFTETGGEPFYDDITPLDINTVFALRFIETFPQSQSENKPGIVTHQSPTFHGAVTPMGRDLVSTFQIAATETWPISDTYRSLSSILALRLSQLPLRMAVALRASINGEKVADAVAYSEDPSSITSEYTWPNPLEIYCDFTGQADSVSVDLAKKCVARDLDVLRGFFRDRMLIKTLALIAKSMGINAETLPGHQIVPRLLELRDEDRAQSMASTLLLHMEAELRDEDAGANAAESLETFEVIYASQMSDIDKLMEIISLGNERDGVEGLIKWYRHVSGLGNSSSAMKSYLIHGTLGARNTWKYTLSEDMLISLLDLCFVEDTGLESSEVPFVKRQLNIEELLFRLKSRFGILISEPPSQFDTAETRAAATSNLEHFVSVLRQLGCFQGLSDDFNSQFVSRPRKTK